MELNETARELLREAGITVAEWAHAQYFTDGVWRGDVCGCPDDRCVGFHHHEDDDCGCLSAFLDEYPRDRDH